MKTIAITLLLLCIKLALIGQNFWIKGRVLDPADGQPIVGATIVDSVSHNGMFTDTLGFFRLKCYKIPDQIHIRFVDYRDTTISGIAQRWPIGTESYDLGDIYLQPVTQGFEYPVFPEPPRRPIEPSMCLVTIQILAYINRMDRINPRQYGRGDLSSIEQGLNLLPGVRFESRGPGGSRRLAIRGGFLRSQFGVRDVKAYLDDVPITSPDGSTPLEIIDMLALRETEVLKGPCASEYGPVSNGVLLFKSGALAVHTSDERRNAHRGAGGAINQAIGSFGYLRTAAQVHCRERLSLTYVRQRYAGYRAQESNAKDFMQLQGRHNIGRNRLSVNLLLFQGNWGLPGSLDSTQVAADPRQALPISQSLDAHVERRHARLTLGDHIYINQTMSVVAAAYLHLADKVNPFGTSVFNQGYKVENSQGIGARSVWSYNNTLNGLKLGGEYQVEWLDGKQYYNNLGNPGALQITALTRSTQVHALAEVFRRFKVHCLTAQASLAQVTYNQQNAFSTLEPIAQGKSQLKPAAAGAFIWGYKTSNYFLRSFFVKVATSYSPPALWEITDSTGRMRDDLKPESGFNVEWRGIGNFLAHRIHAEANVYHHSIWNTIVPQNLNSGRVHYLNQGRTTQMGIEAMLQVKNILSGKPIGKKLGLDFATNAAYQYYYFNDYAVHGTSFQGKAIPGVPRFTWNAMLDFGFGRMFPTLQVTSQVIGKTYLDNANLVAQPIYYLLNLKASKSFNFMKTGHRSYSTIVPYRFIAAELTPYIGINNILDAQYTNFPQLNAIAGRYYNPAPGRNWYAGVDFRF